MARDESLHIAAANFSTMNNSLKEASNRRAENMRDLHEGIINLPRT
ncbi:hypothetical protein [Vibrio phage J14]|nr:hypothetical protein [Vibrio phage J14]